MHAVLHPFRLALVGSLSAFVLAGCGGTSGSPSSAATASSAHGVDQTLHISYANGKVSGVSAREKVRLKSVVSLVVTSDVADEVHLHGYDKHVDVPKNGTATLTFTANIPGIFEVELESLKHRLVLLQVQ
ncbi:MAG: hypothetical protein QOJ68_1116 [Blastococcus sp.]|nr:hypothetical protein [Blastococcus sp.]